MCRISIKTILNMVQTILDIGLHHMGYQYPRIYRYNIIVIIILVV